MFKKIWRVCCFCLALMFFSSVGAYEIDKTRPFQMMQEVSKRLFTRLYNEQLKIHQNPEYLKVVVEEELMPYVNEQYAALKLLSLNLRGKDKGEVRTFIKSFRKYLVTSYAKVLAQYTDQRIELGPEPELGSEKRIVGIKFKIINTVQPNIELEFRLRKDQKTGEWEAFDVIVEGISLLLSKRSEWGGKIRQEGLISVANKLNELADQAIKFESKGL
ncbi:phospholipid ABC transporter protein [Candidatus Photodesmus blepharus]|uniref:Phospholipid ABC transporter protein n=1 Tax=Candidatus Photodesmus blepharonis TaxID=1179155 RepID=A0A084CM38_9GAMM|nr:ABC transporter substrate-binding protein [Candidatus Photodesmus blepharus]KEY90867.1 phospholipid ABC transporter protein [Candidatus Photodesmus blepharus]